MKINQILSFTSGRLYALNGESMQDVLAPVAYHIMKQKDPNVTLDAISTLGIMAAKEMYTKEPELLKFPDVIQEMIGWWRHDDNWKERIVALDKWYEDIQPL